MNGHIIHLLIHSFVLRLLVHSSARSRVRLHARPRIRNLLNRFIISTFCVIFSLLSRQRGAPHARPGALQAVLGPAGGNG
jgi:hypothetical protein